MAKGKIYIGTSGWHYKEWRGEFYPEKMKTGDWLEFYAKTYKTTEINNSFYRLPSEETVAKWADTVPDDFIFCPKMSRYLSHMKKLNDPEEPLQRFFEIFKPMIAKKKMGPILVQLPANAPFKHDTVEHFYKLLYDEYSKYSFAMEIRHKSWLEKESIDMMKKYNIAFVIAQSERFVYAEHITAKDIYVRFHGPKRLYGSSYSDEQLKEYAKKFKRWQKDGHNIWAFFNNDMDVIAIGDSQRLIEMVK